MSTFNGRMYFGREILRQDFEPMYIKTGTNNVEQRMAAAQVNIPTQRAYKDLNDYASDNASAYPHVFIVGLESDPAKLHKRPGLLAKGSSGIIVQHQKATRNATINGLNHWRESFTPEMLSDEERELVGIRRIASDVTEEETESMFEDGLVQYDNDNNAWTIGEPFVILDASSIGLEIPVTFEDKVAIAKASEMWPMLDMADDLETTDSTRFKAFVLMVYKFETK